MCWLGFDISYICINACAVFDCVSMSFEHFLCNLLRGVILNILWVCVGYALVHCTFGLTCARRLLCVISSIHFLCNSLHNGVLNILWDHVGYGLIHYTFDLTLVWRLIVCPFLSCIFVQFNELRPWWYERLQRPTSHPTMTKLNKFNEHTCQQARR